MSIYYPHFDKLNVPSEIIIITLHM